MFSPDYVRSVIQSREYDTISIFTYDGTKQVDHLTGDKLAMLECFDMFYTNCEQGKYNVNLYQDGKQTGGGGRSDITRRKIIPIQKVVASNTNMVGGSNILMQQNMDLQAQLIEMRFDQKLKDFQNEHSSQGYSMLRELLVHFKGSKTATDVSESVTGAKDSPHSDEASDEDNKVLVETLTKWQNIDPNFLERMKNLISLAEKDRSKYDMAANMLKDQSV